MRTATLFCTCDEGGWAYCRACDFPAPTCPRCGCETDPDWYCSEGYCPDCCTETDEDNDNEGDN